MAFRGFTNNGISFLKSLASNNNKDWFGENKSVYEEHILEPLRQLTTELGFVIKNIDANIETTPAINKTISKIHRDIRFSKDKSPFRTNMWISFKRPFKIWGNSPEFYFYFTPIEYQYGMGFYSASPENMKNFRHYIVAYPDKFKKAIAFYNPQNAFVLVGEQYRKNIPNQLPSEYQEWFQKKNLCISRIKAIDKTFFSSRLKNKIEDAFKVNAELYHLLIDSAVQK